MTLNPPETLAQSRIPISGIHPDTPASVTCIPYPPLYRADTGTHPAGHTANWLAEKINTTRRQAHRDTCRHCGQPILTGDDADTCALTAHVNPNPVTRLEEAVAILNGHTSYSHLHGELHRRDTWSQLTTRYPTLIDHTCPTTPEPAHQTELFT